MSFDPQVNILLGDNGQGKTSLLEALCIATTSRSFRTDQSRDIISSGSNRATAEVDVDEAGLTRTQRVEIASGKKTMTVDGKRLARAADFAVLTPLVVFHPADLELVAGSAALRRILLARVSLYLEPWTFESRKSHLQALRERQRLLLDRGTSAPGLDAFEQVASEHGVIVSTANAHAAERLIAAFDPIILQLAPAGLRAQATHLAHGTTNIDDFRRLLRESRQRDLLRGRSLFGPQRDDLLLWIGDVDARRHASQGQQRLLALVLKLAEFSSIRTVRGVHPILLLDDVTSELDSHRTSAIFDWLHESSSQIFVTATRWDAPKRHFDLGATSRHFQLRGGVAEQEIRLP